MKKTAQTSNVLPVITVPPLMDYETLLSKLSVKDRQSFERQILACETKSDSALAERWRRLGCLLMTLAPHRAKLTGMHTVQFFIPDGKYRKQVFALHAIEDGAIAICATNVLDEAIRAGLLAAPALAGSDVYRLPESGESLSIASLDGNTPNPPFFCKDMTGWNRKAICMTLPPKSTPAQLAAVEHLCALAAMDWAETVPQ